VWFCEAFRKSCGKTPGETQQVYFLLTIATIENAGKVKKYHGNIKQ
jgi:hypothetical protein